MINIFQNDIKDFIEQTLTGVTAQYRNDAQARLRGIELEGSYRISNYNFILSAGAVRGENETLGTDLTGIPGDRVILIGDHGLEREWCAAGRLAAYLPADRYFAPPAQRP